jgi:hypothetical protein
MYTALNEGGADLYPIVKRMVEVARTFRPDSVDEAEEILEPVSVRRRPRKKKKRKKKARVRHNDPVVYEALLELVEVLGPVGEKIACALIRAEFPEPPEKFPGLLVGRTKDVFEKSVRLNRPDRYHGPLLD